MRASRVPLAMLAVIIGFLVGGFEAHAADLMGAWASDASACTKIFSRKNGSITFAADADLYGSGLIIEKNRIRGKMAACDIIARKDDGNVTSLVARCKTDIAFDTVQFSLKIEDNNKITRFYPGIAELATSYYRCSL